MEEALKHGNDNNPLDHNVEAGLPGVHARMAATASEVAAVNAKIDTNFKKIEGRFDEMNNSVNCFMESVRATQDALSNHLIRLGEGLQGHGQQVHRVSQQHNIFPVDDQHGDQQQQQQLLQPVDFPRDNNGIPLAAKVHHLQFKHKTLHSLFNEWYGLEEYHAVPVPGGLDILEMDYKNKWRKHFSASENKAFSRLKRVIKGINNQIERTGMSPLDVLDGWQRMYESELKCSVLKLEEWLRTQRLITTAAPRGKQGRT